MTLDFTIEHPPGLKELGQALAERCRQRTGRGDASRRPPRRRFASTRFRGTNVTDPVHAVRAQTERQVAHWCCGVRAGSQRPGRARGVEPSRAVPRLSLRRHLQGVIDRLARRRGCADVDESRGPQPDRARRGAAAAARLRRQFLRAETTLDYFADAIGTRTNLERQRCFAPATRSRIAAWRRSWTARQATPPASDLHRQRARRVDSEGGPAAVGRRRSEPGRRGQDHPAQPAAPDRSDS